VLAPDVEFQAAASAVLHGRDAVLAYLGGLGGDGARGELPVGRYVPQGGRPSIRHYTSTVQIDLTSETTARVRSYYAVLSSFGLDHWGRYLDEFGVVDGEWLITKRTVTTEGVDPNGWAAALTGAGPDASA
jgi:SnoaL-like protein